MNPSSSKLFIVLCFLIVFSGHGQDLTTDRQKYNHDESIAQSRVDALNQIAVSVVDTAAEKGLAYAQNARILSRKINYKKGEAISLNILGKAYLKLKYGDSARSCLITASHLLDNIPGLMERAENCNLLGECFAAQNKYDSAITYYEKALTIVREVKANREIQVRSHRLIGAASSYMGNYDEALIHFNKSLQLGKMLNDHAAIAATLEGIAHIKRLQGKYQEGLATFREALTLYEKIKSRPGIAGCYNGIGQLYQLKGDYDSALNYHFKSLKIFERLNERSKIIQVVNSIGIVYIRLGDYEKAIMYIRRCLDMPESSANKRLQIALLSNLGSVYQILEHYDSARLCFNDAIRKAEDIEARENIAALENNLALIYLRENKYDSALICFQHALRLAEESRNETYVVNTNNNIGKVYVKMRNPEKGIFYHQRALTGARKIGAKGLLKDAYSNLSEAYSEVHNYKEALTYYKLYSNLYDSLVGEEKDKVIAEINAKYELERKDRELIQQNLFIQKSELKLLRQRNYIAALLTCIVMLIAAAGIIRFRQNKRRLMLKVELEQKNFKIQQQLELAELKSNFLTSVSHEFRTPLTLILGPLEQLLKQKTDPFSIKQYEVMQRNANHLLDLINQIMDLSKIESGHIRLHARHQDVVSFFKEIFQSFAPLSEVRKVSLNLDCPDEPVSIYFDRKQFEKVIRNLLGNAFKHTKEGDSISVKVFREDSNSFVGIEVTDNGEGIPSEHIPFIFNRFYQVEYEGNHSGGIGLAVVKQIMEMHHGEIDVQSQYRKGTSFLLKLPSGKAHFKPDELEEEHTDHELDKHIFPQTVDSDYGVVKRSFGKPDKKCVLIVEDHHGVRQYLVDLLGPLYDVIEATDGETGLALAVARCPDLIISDILMPNKDGYAFAGDIKNNIATSHIPVILLTAKADHTDKVKGLETGADDYITKPFHPDELLVRSRNLMEQRDKLRILFAQNPLTNPAGLTVTRLDEQFLARATKIVLENIDDPELNVEKFCREMGMSHSGLHTKLKALTGQSITRFIRRLRLKKASDLIEDNSKTMMDIAFAVGFNNRQFFIRSFKEQYGMTPTEYRSRLYAEYAKSAHNS